MEFVFIVLGILFQCMHTAAQDAFTDNPPWQVSGSVSQVHSIGQTIFTYNVVAGSGKVTHFVAGIPSCPEIQILGNSRFSLERNSQLRGIQFSTDILPGRTYTFTITVSGIVNTQNINYAVNGDEPTWQGGWHHKWSSGTIIGPQCTKTPIISCDLSKQRYVGECLGNTVRVPLMTHSKYHTKLKWSTDYPGCSFTQIDTVHPTIAFHGPICDTEFRVKLELWGPANQYEKCFATIYATDTVSPTFAGIYGPQDTTVECDDIPAPLQIFAKDVCDNDVDVEYSENEETVVYGDYSVYRKWIAVDYCDNKATYRQKVLVKDSQPPRLVGVPADETVNCDIEVKPCAVTAFDNCDDVTVDFSSKVVEGSCLDNWKVIRTWISKDSSHNAVSATQTVSVVDNQSPELWGVPNDVTVNCDEVPANIVPSTTDNCEEDISVVIDERTIPGTCIDSYRIIRTFSVVDVCGNHNSATWNVWVVDNIDPTLSGISSNYGTVPCDNVPAPCVVEANDNCATFEVTVDPVVNVINEDCIGNYTLSYHWSITDNCGNTASAAKEIVVIDNEPPTFTQQIPEIIRFNCVPGPALIIAAVDNCGEASVEAHPPVKQNEDCLFNYELYYSWTATDECGLTAELEQIFRISDNVPPVLVGAPPDLSLPCDQDIPDFQVTAYDNCDLCGTPIIEPLPVSSGGQQDCDNWIIKKYYVQDCCGLTASHVHTIHFYDDVKPVLIGVPNSQYVSIDDVQNIDPNPTVTATDNCDDNLIVEFESLNVEGSCPHNFKTIRRWWTTDDCGNKISAAQTIYCDDTVPPEFVNPVYESITDCYAPHFPEIEVTDNGNSYTVEKNEVRTTIKGTCEHEYTVVRDFVATDICGNTAEKSYTVSIFDLEPPRWTSLPHQTDDLIIRNTRAQYEASYVDEVAAFDLCAGEIPVQAEETVIDSSCSNEYYIVRKWTASDDCGNTIVLRRTIDVRDLEPPTLINVPPHTTVDCTEDWRDTYDPPLAVDYGGDGFALDITTTLTILGSEACESNVTAVKCWRVHDCVGHTTRECQTITVRDHRVPQWTYLPPDKVVPCDNIPEAKVLSATDECSHASVSMVENRVPGTCDHEFTITRTYVAIDDCDLSITYIQTISVIDNHDPYSSSNSVFNIQTKVPPTEILECGAFSRYVPVVCSDDCDSSPKVKRSSRNEDGTCDGDTILVRVWTCEDACGNTATAEQKIFFKDTVPPRFNYQPTDLELPCGKGSVIPDVPQNIRALDDCDNNPALDYDEFLKPGAYGWQSSENIRIWVATDHCGNKAEMQQTIVVYDDIPPRVVVPGNPDPIECHEDEQPLNFISVSDNCDPDPQVDVDISVSAVNDCVIKGRSFYKTYEWCPRDKSGNVGTCKTALVVVADGSNPKWSHIPHNRHVSYTLDDTAHDDTLTCTDKCDGVQMTMDTVGSVDGSCPNEQVIVYNYHCADLCGNTITTSQSIIVSDDVPPPLEPLPESRTIECGYGAIPEPPVLFSNDPYSLSPLEVQFNERPLPTSCAQNVKIERKWWVTDCAGNLNSWVQTLSILDTRDPELPDIEDETFECDTGDYYIDVVAYDKCDESVDVVFTSEDCGSGSCWKEICRQWTATDDCGNYDVEVQTIRIDDQKPPEVYGSPKDITTDVHNVPGQYSFTCTDNCFNDIVTAEMIEETTDGSCPEEYTLTRTWTCTDGCGQEGTTVQVITVADQEKPVLSHCPQDITVQEGLEPPWPTITAMDGQVYGDVPVVPDEDEEKNLAYDRQIQRWIYRSWAAEDNCGNLALCTQTITVIDTIPPIIPDVPRDKYMDCDDEIFLPAIPPSTWTNWYSSYLAVSRQLEQAIADDQITIWPTCPQGIGPQGQSSDYSNCDPFPFDEKYNKVPGTCKGEYTIKRTWTATDHAGNSLSDTQVITVVDDRPPTFDSTPPSTTSYECHHQDENGLISATDNCDPYIIVDPSERKIRGTCVHDYILVRSWFVTDSCGNSASMRQSVWVTDSLPPVLDSAPESESFECTEYSSLPAPADLKCTDNCAGDIVPRFSSEKHSGSCDDDWIFIRTWTCADLCGHSVINRQTLYVIDTTKPEFTGDYITDITVACDAPTPVPLVTATDDCSEYVQVHYEVIGSSVDYSTNQYIQKWTVWDACGNDHSKERTLQIVDLEDPVISPKPPHVTVSCDSYSEYQMPEPHCDDNCGSPDLSRDVQTNDGTCENEYDLIVTWRCTDQHERTDTHIMTVSVVDDEDPAFNVYSLQVTAPCNEVPLAPSVHANDNCDEVTVSFNEDKDYPDYVELSRASPPVFSMTDPAMSYAWQWGKYWWMPTQYYTVSPMNIGKLGSTNGKTFSVGRSVLRGNFESGFLQCSMKCNREDLCDCFMQWGVEDQRRCYFFNTQQCAYIRSEAYKIPNVQSKFTEGPVADEHTYGFKFSSEPDSLVNFVDPGIPQIVPGPVKLCDRYTLKRVWTASDKCGNAVEKIHEITVWDVTPPFFSLIPRDVTTDCSYGMQYENPNDLDTESALHGVRAPKAHDECSPVVDLVEVFEEDLGECDSNTVYTFTWTATDDCGLKATAVMKLTKKDDTPPTLSFLPPSAGYECTENDEEPDLPDVTATDDCNAVTVEVSFIIKDVGCNNSWVYTWTATDECGNEASKSMQIFIYDSTPPVLENVPDTTIDCADPYIPDTPTATDECNEVTVTRSVDNLYPDCPTTKESIYTWVAVDDCGNRVVKTTTVTTIDDDPPSIWNVPEDTTAQCQTSWIESNVRCTDDCGDGRLTITYDSVESDCEVTGIYYIQYRHWTCLDICGNSAEESLTITVADNLPPTISKPDDQTIQCDDSITDPTANADDDCEEVTLTSSKQTIQGSCEDEYKIVKTWVAVDKCGRVITKDHTLTVVDGEAPLLTGVPEDVSVDCARVPEAANVQATDNCANPVVHFDETRDTESYTCNDYEIIREWYVVDDCNNRVADKQTITVTDTTDPTLTCNGQVDCEDMQIECDFMPPLPIIVAQDDCFEHTVVTYVPSNVPGTCEHDHVETRTWTTDDACGHIISIDQVITYVDDTAPVFEGDCEDVTVDCTESVPIAVLTANDNCDYVLDIEYNADRDEDSCNQVYTEVRTWVARDVCGHSSSMIQTVTVVDNEPPHFSYIPLHTNAECHMLKHAWAGEITAQDNCDYELSVKFRETRVNGSCDDAYILIRSWSATDCSGNVGEQEQTIVVDDTIPPTFNGALPADFTVSLDDIYSGTADFIDPLTVTGHDNCATIIVDFSKIDVPIDYDCDYITYRIFTWTITDNCGNSETRIQTIEMVRTASPEFIPIEDIYVECDSVPPPCDAELVDPDSYAVTVNFYETEVDGSCEDQYDIRRTWVANDCAFNGATMTQVVHVLDRTPPIFSRNLEDTTVECGCEFPAVPDIDAIDNCDSEGDTLAFDETSSPGTCEHSFTVKREWIASDACGNSETMTQYIHVVDTEAPLFCEDCRDYGDDEDPVLCNAISDLPKPLVKDDCDSDIDVTVLTAGIDIGTGGCAGDRTILWEWLATDNCGNSDTCQSTVYVEDVDAPQCANCNQLCFPLTDYGPTVNNYAVYTNPNTLVTADDDCGDATVTFLHCNSSQSIPDGDCQYYPRQRSLYVKITSNDDDHLGRFYYLWFKLVDECGNDRVVSRPVWVPQTSFAYFRAVDRGLCLNGLGTELFKQSPPINIGPGRTSGSDRG